MHLAVARGFLAFFVLKGLFTRRLFTPLLFQVRVYRLISKATLEERVFLRARKKLLLNQLVVKSGGDISATENDDAVLGVWVGLFC